MKRRHLAFINLVFVGLMLFSSGMVYQFMTGSKPLAALDIFKHTSTVKITTANCNARAPIALSGAQSPYLYKLAVYQEACHSFVTSTMMIFVGMPTSDQTAHDSAAQTAAVLKEFGHYGIRPLVIAEPTDYATGENLDFGSCANGTYDALLDTYFSQLKSLGVTDQQMGIWNPFPEANLPYWKDNLSQYFAPAVNDYVGLLRKNFPQAKTSIMLNTATYEPTDFNWQNGDYTSLLPYVKGITPGSIDYAGLEGFPWIPPQGGTGPILNAAEFLNPSIISETADYLKTKNIWFNAGTFSEKYALDPAQIAYLSPEQRKAILNTIEEQARVLQKRGYQISVNMFAQDKSKASEETNWSYWSNNSPFTSLATPAFTEFVSDLGQQKIDFWLFDQ